MARIERKKMTANAFAFIKATLGIDGQFLPYKAVTKTQVVSHATDKYPLKRVRAKAVKSFGESNIKDMPGGNGFYVRYGDHDILVDYRGGVKNQPTVILNHNFYVRDNDTTKYAKHVAAVEREAKQEARKLAQRVSKH